MLKFALSFALSFLSHVASATESSLIRYDKIIAKATEPHEECDRQQQTKVRSVLEVLEANRQAIGELQLPKRQIAEKVQRTTPQGHQLVVRYESWDKAQQLLSDLNNSQPQENPGAWLNLSRYAEHLLYHDHKRIVESINYQIDYATARYAGAVRSKLLNCLMDKSCLQISVSPQENQFLLAKENYKYAWREYLAVTDEQKRMWLGLLDYQLNKDLENLGFKVNSTITRSGKTFILPLIAGDFAKEKGKIEAAVRNHWKSANGWQIKIRWVLSPQQPSEIFRLTRNPHLNGGAHVDEENFQIFLDSAETPSEIAHEIGHALGFRDEYYRSWEASTCRYKDEFDLSNLMSFPETGRALQQHWVTMDRVY